MSIKEWQVSLPRIHLTEGLELEEELSSMQEQTKAIGPLTVPGDSDPTLTGSGFCTFPGFQRRSPSMKAVELKHCLPQ